MINESGLAVEAEIEPVSSARADFPVALVSMPFVSYHRPSIQLGLLKAIGEKYGFPVTTFHFNLDFARQIGPEEYELLCDFRGHLLGDWLFAKEAFGEAAPQDDTFLDLEGLRIGKDLTALVENKQKMEDIRSHQIPAYLDRLVEIIDWGQFKVVGFTSTFQQNAPSFALAARIKQRYPQVQTVFGGSNFEGEMGLELTRTIKSIDYAVIGEGDKAFPEFLIALQEGRDPTEVRGVVTRRDGQVTPLSTRPPLRSLDELPTPDYTEYFERATSLDLLPQNPNDRIMLPFESSRGCWWGQKHQCTFCGLNGTGIFYRAKSPEKMKAELTELAKYYPNPVMEAVDNIMDMSYITTVFQEFSQTKPGYELFYEVKANLSREQLKLLHSGGVVKIQPGIESLNSHVLKLMRKGITASQNINAIRWARYYNIGVGWNVLWGFPGETAEDYQQQAALIPHLIHLFPPDGYGRIWMERFSPIYFEKDNFPTRFVKPEASYRYIYPEAVNLEKIAYFFDYEFEETLPDTTYRDMVAELQKWNKAWEQETKPRLLYWAYNDFLKIEDLRNQDEPRSYTVDEPLASIYLAFSDRPHTALAVKTKLDLKMPVSELEQQLQKFCDLGLMMKDGNYYLCLAIPGSKPRVAIKDGFICQSLPPEPVETPTRELAFV